MTNFCQSTESGTGGYELHLSTKIIFLKIRQPPIFPYRRQHSIFGRLGLNHRVRDGNGCYPQTYRHRKQLRKESDLSSSALPLSYKLLDN